MEHSVYLWDFCCFIEKVTHVLKHYNFRQQVNILGTLKPERQKCIVGVETKYSLLDYYEKKW